MPVGGQPKPHRTEDATDKRYEILSRFIHFPHPCSFRPRHDCSKLFIDRGNNERAESHEKVCVVWWLQKAHNYYLPGMIDVTVTM